MSPHAALQETPTTTPATAAASMLAIDVMAGDHPLEACVEMIAGHFTAMPRIEVFTAVLTSLPPQDPTGWRPLGGRAWVQEWQAPGSTCSALPPPDAGPEAALSMPWVSQFARADVVALVDVELLPEEAAQDRRELETVGIRSFVASATRSQDQMFGSLSLGSTQAGRWPEEHIADLRLLNAALSARTTLEQARRSLADSIEAAARTRQVHDQFLASVGHELRTPLTTVLGYTEMLLDEAAAEPGHPLADVVERDSRIIISSCEKLLTVVDAVLDAGRTLRGIEGRQHVEVTAAVGDVVHWHQGAARSNGVTITNRVADDASVWASPEGLRQIMSTLVGNAVVHNRRGGSVDISTQPLTGEVGEPRLRVVVRDTGPGLNRDQLRAAFTIVPASDDDGGGDRGLGLSLARSLAERDDGSVGAESTPGVGSAFWVELPQGPTDSAGPDPLR